MQTNQYCVLQWFRLITGPVCGLRGHHLEREGRGEEGGKDRPGRERGGHRGQEVDGHRRLRREKVGRDTGEW